MNSNGKMSWSLKIKLTFFMSAIFLISIWSLALYASRMLQRDTYQLLGEQQFTTASIVASQINQELDDRFKGLENIAGQITPAILSDAATLQALLENRPVLQEMFNGGTFATQLDGTATASAPFSSGRIGVNFIDRDYIAAALKEGKSTVGRPIIGKATLNPSFVMAVPIRDVQDKVIGALAGVVYLSKPNFLDKLTNNRYGKTGGYVLVAPQYRLVVTATDKSRIMTPLPASGVIPSIDRHVDGYEGATILVNPLGVEILSSMKRIPLAGWYLSVTLPTTEAFAPIQKMQYHIFLAAILLTCIAAGLTWWMLRKLLSPMFATVTTLAAMADSGQPQPLPIVRQDEIGKLIGGFNGLLKILAQREEALRKSEFFFKESQRSASIGSYHADFITDKWESSEVMDTIFGIDKDYDRSIQGLLTIVHPDDRDMMKRHLMEDVMSNRKPFSKEYRIIRRSDGETRWVKGKGVPTFDNNGTPLSLIGTIRDITERKHAEEENKSLQTKLLQAQKMEAIGTLAGGIAHDFNNILSAILGYTEIARDDTPPGSLAANSLDKVLGASQRAATLVKQILAFSRQENVKRIPLELGPIVKDATKFLRPSIPSTVEIRQQFETTTRPILADPTQLHQILINLCTNAFHAMEQTGGILEITCEDCELSQSDLLKHPEVRPGSFVMLSISDTGTGIDPDIRDRIFDPYFTTKEVGKGTGMGLSIVHGIVTSYGGFITSEKNPNCNGSIFRVLFPAIDQESPPEVTSVEVTPHGNEHLLFVDDEEMLAELGKMILEQLGYNVTACTSSRDAWDTFRNQPNRFDAVVTDQTMPGLTGMDLAQQILQIRPDIPIILSTGYSTLVNEEQAKSAGIKGFVMKPLSKKVIATLLRKVLDRERLGINHELIL